MKIIMMTFLKRIYHFLLKYKRKKYLDALVQNGLQVGENVVIMDGCFFDPSHCFLITIGDNSVLAPGVRLITHDASMKRIIGYAKIGKVTIEKNCFIGDSVIVLPGVTIGQGSVIGAGAVVTRDIPSKSVAAGDPCRVISNRKEYTQKCEVQLAKRKTPFAEHSQTRLTTAQKKEISNFLDSGTGYIR